MSISSVSGTNAAALAQQLQNQASSGTQADSAAQTDPGQQAVRGHHHHHERDSGTDASPQAASSSASASSTSAASNSLLNTLV